MHLANHRRTEGLNRRRPGGHRPSRRIYRPGRFYHRARRALAHLNHLAPLNHICMQSQWFVIHTLSGQEQKVKDSIERRLKTEEMGEFIQEVLVPIEKVVEVRNGKKSVTTRKLHPGYVYIDMVLLDENRRVLPKPYYFIKE